MKEKYLITGKNHRNKNYDAKYLDASPRYVTNNSSYVQFKKLYE